MMYDLKSTSLGLWVDLPKRMVLTQEFFDWFSNTLRFDLMSIMIDASDAEVDFSWGIKDIEKVIKLAYKPSTEIGLTTWPYPRLEQLRLMEKKMNALLSAGGGYIDEWETDEEFNWDEDEVEGFSSLDQAGDALVDMKRRLCERHSARNTMTTFTYHMENGPRADTAQHMDRVVVQAYAVDERQGKPISWGHRYGPGRMQKLTLARTMKIPGAADPDSTLQIGVGHAAWAQDGFKVQVVDDVGVSRLQSVPKQAMRISFEAALDFLPVAPNWWSAKYVYPKSPRYLPYAEEFLTSLRAGI